MRLPGEVGLLIFDWCQFDLEKAERLPGLCAERFDAEGENAGLRDVEAAKDFYGKALGWEFEPFDSPGAATYWLIKVPGKKRGSPFSDDDLNGGMLTLGDDFPPEMPANWSVYFASADVDADVSTLTELGGTLVAGIMDTSAGRMAVVSDPQGGVFMLIAPPEPS